MKSETPGQLKTGREFFFLCMICISGVVMLLLSGYSEPYRKLYRKQILKEKYAGI